MVSIVFTEDNKPVEKKTAKGVSKNITKRTLRQQDYKSCLFEKQMQMRQLNQIRGDNHHIYSHNLTKISLSSYDDKRYILPDGCHTFAYWH